jgi:mycothiol synthase
LESRDYRVISAVTNSLYPERPVSVSETRFEDSIRDPRCFLKRWVAERNGRQVGFAELTQSSELYHPNRYIFRLGVLPHHQNRGVGTALYDEVAATLGSLGDISVRALARDDMSGAIRFMEKRGFRPGMNFSDYILDLQKMSPAEISKRAASLKWRGSIRTFDELPSGKGRDQRLFELEKTVQLATPYPEPLDALNFGYFQRAILGNPRFLADGYFVAVEGKRYLGVCSLYCRDTNNVAYVRLSGVVPDRRGEGIATALKSRALAYAKHKGFQAVMTRNESTNSPILAINKNANFDHFSTWVHMSRTF